MLYSPRTILEHIYEQTFRFVSPSKLAVVTWHEPSSRSEDRSTKSAGKISSLAIRTISPTYKKLGEKGLHTLKGKDLFSFCSREMAYLTFYVFFEM